jgi:hypothetical protein
MVRFVVVALLAGTLVACGGEQGPPGPAPGAVSNRYCSRLDSNLLFEYQVVRFSSGDLQVICSITDISSEHTASIYYRAGDSGTATALCRLGYDFDVANGGYFDFRADSGERATYADAGSSSNGWVVAFAGTDCVG